MRVQAIFLMAMTLFSASCNTVPNGFSVSSELNNTQWRLVSLEPMAEGAMAIPAQPELTLRMRDNQVSGYDGCNDFSGPIVSSWGSSASALRFGSFTTTLVPCQGEAGKVAEAYTDALAQVESYVISGDQLNLYFDQGRSTLSFSRMPAAETQDDA